MVKNLGAFLDEYYINIKRLLALNTTSWQRYTEYERFGLRKYCCSLVIELWWRFRYINTRCFSDSFPSCRLRRFFRRISGIAMSASRSVHRRARFTYPRCPEFESWLFHRCYGVHGFEWSFLKAYWMDFNKMWPSLLGPDGPWVPLVGLSTWYWHCMCLWSGKHKHTSGSGRAQLVLSLVQTEQFSPCRTVVQIFMFPVGWTFITLVLLSSSIIILFNFIYKDTFHTQRQIQCALQGRLKRLIQCQNWLKK